MERSGRQNHNAMAEKQQVWKRVTRKIPHLSKRLRVGSGGVGEADADVISEQVDQEQVAQLARVARDLSITHSQIKQYSNREC